MSILIIEIKDNFIFNISRQIYDFFAIYFDRDHLFI